MKIHISNGKFVDLGDQVQSVATKGTGLTNAIETSFLSEFLAKVKGNVIHIEERMRAYCLNKVHDRIKGKYDSYFEILGGVGVTAKIFGDNEAKTIVNDFDPACQSFLKANFPTALVTGEDMFQFPLWPAFVTKGAIACPLPVDTSFVDYNNFTLQKFGGVYFELTRNLFAYTDKYMIINDCSVFYLNRGAKSFAVYSKILGETVTNYTEFYAALARYYAVAFPQWQLISVDKFYASSYLLFERKRADGHMPDVVHHTSEEMKAAPVLSLEL